MPAKVVDLVEPGIAGGSGQCGVRHAAFGGISRAGKGNGVLFYDPTGHGALTQKNQVVFTSWDPSAKSDMQAGLSALPDPFRETVILRDLHGLSYREIAERTKVPIGTVMSRLARARGRFLTVLAKDEARQN